MHFILVYEYAALQPWVKWMDLKYGGLIAHIYTYLYIFISTAYDWRSMGKCMYISSLNFILYVVQVHWEHILTLAYMSAYLTFFTLLSFMSRLPRPARFIPAYLHCTLFPFIHCKKRIPIFPYLAGMSLTKHSMAGNNLIFTGRPWRVWLVTSRLGTGELLTFVLQCMRFSQNNPFMFIFCFQLTRPTRFAPSCFPSLHFPIFKGTGSPDGYRFCWHAWLNLVLSKGRSWFWKLLGDPLICHWVGLTLHNCKNVDKPLCLTNKVPIWTNKALATSNSSVIVIKIYVAFD